MHSDDSPPRRPAARWLPAAAAVGVLAVVIGAGVALGGGNADVATTAPVLQADEAAVPLTVPDSVPDVVATVATTSPVAKSQLDRTLAKGVAGGDVQEVQERLTDLGFAPGPTDGIFGDETIKAVWAYEKLVLGVDSNQPTGQVTPEMWDAMQEPFVIQPRRPDSTPNHTEVYLPEQVLAVFQDDQPVLITHMSSGTNEEWCEEVTISPGEYGNRDGEEPIVRGECGRSNTPGGVFEYYRQVEGIRDSALGSMWNPVYFNYGIAIHGALNVPLQPASHGCIRIPLNISEGLQDLMDMGDKVFVWDGEKEPEENGAPPPTFNWLDPDYETTTTVPESSPTLPESSTTTPPSTDPATTVAPTTPAPVTTSPPTSPPSTQAPAATTTTTTTMPSTTTTTTTTVTMVAPTTSSTTTTAPALIGVGG
ncbi:MAG: L,D-transpeptidase family protein [Ilumatobacter sp.]|uniref:L,D-transpeptidase family protein n=1 Tax=Ilumatobacter sp. TaxID=1967498 RepID=UPI003C774C07